MKGHFPSAAIIATGLLLADSPALAQISGEHYLAGTEGIQAGSLPGPGVYFDDINWFGHLTGTEGMGQNTRISSYVNEPRIRWISKTKLLGANYGVELTIPWGYQEQHLSQPPTYSFSNPGQPFLPIIRPGYNYHYGQYEVHDLEVSPLLLGWHWQHFDLTAGYAFWVPTDDNSFNGAGNDPFNPTGYAPPAQYHWWEHLITLGGTWYLDAGQKWAVSDLSHYEINQPFDSPIGTTKYGQLFTTEWGISRTAGKYFTLGLIGNYSQQITATRTVNSGDAYTFYSAPQVEIGPEIKVTVPKYDFSASLRYLRQLNNPNGSTGSFNLNMIALTLSKRF